jgi:hypothetical protein
MSAQTKTTEPTITVPARLFRALFAAAPPTTEQILEVIRDYGHHQRYQASQHTGAAQQMFFDKAAAARDIERKIVTLMGADHD